MFGNNVEVKYGVIVIEVYFFGISYFKVGFEGINCGFFQMIKVFIGYVMFDGISSVGFVVVV